MDSPHYADWAVAGCTLALVIVTGFLVCYTKRLWRSTSALVETSDATAKAHERAYIVGGGPVAFDAGRPTVAALDIENRGKTPAFIKGVVWGLCPEKEFITNVLVSEIFNKNLLPNYVTTGERNYTDVYPAGGRHIFHRASFDRAGKNGYIFFGMISYEDVHRTHHHSRLQA